jgi:hypothetical protein
MPARSRHADRPTRTGLEHLLRQDNTIMKFNFEAVLPSVQLHPYVPLLLQHPSSLQQKVKFRLRRLVAFSSTSAQTAEPSQRCSHHRRWDSEFNLGAIRWCSRAARILPDPHGISRWQGHEIHFAIDTSSMHKLRGGANGWRMTMATDMAVAPAHTERPALLCMADMECSLLQDVKRPGSRRR